MKRPMFIVISVREPKWADEQKTRIACKVTFSHIKQELDFIAIPIDLDDHGVEIFQRCIAGEFGKIGEYMTENDTRNPYFDKKAATAIPSKIKEIQDFLDQANAELARGTPRRIVLV